jgi:hypothetical protein
MLKWFLFTGLCLSLIWGFVFNHWQYHLTIQNNLTAGFIASGFYFLIAIWVVFFTEGNNG